MAYSFSHTKVLLFYLFFYILKVTTRQGPRATYESLGLRRCGGGGQRGKIAINSGLEEFEIIATWEAAKRKCVPLQCSSREKTCSMKLSVNERNIKKVRVICCYRESKAGVSRKSFDWWDHCLKFIRALTMKVAIEEGKTSNIPSV